MKAPHRITPALLRHHPLPALNLDSSKEDHGRLLVVAGSPETPGAALLAAEAALRVGAGKVAAAVPGALTAALGLARPELWVGGFRKAPSVALFEGRDAWLIGPGMNAAEATRWTAASFRQRSEAVTVLDASALNGLWKHPALPRGRLVITPHHGEMAALSGTPVEQIRKDPAKIARMAAQHLGAIVVLKGATTYIATPSGQTFEHIGDLPGLGVSGSGDVLAGIAAGLAAQEMELLSACLWAVTLHAQAGEQLQQSMGPTGYLAAELPGCLPGLLRRHRKCRPR